MDESISRQAAIDALKKAYWDKDIQSAKNDPCIVDAMTDWAIRQVKAMPSAQVGTEMSSTGETVTINSEPPKMYGWVCPICGRGLSPFTRVCPCQDRWEVTCYG